MMKRITRADTHRRTGAVRVEQLLWAKSGQWILEVLDWTMRTNVLVALSQLHREPVATEEIIPRAAVARR